MSDTIRIGTRGSRMALHQAELVMSLLRQRHRGMRFQITTIRSLGDEVLGDLREIGGKGAFISRLDSALAGGEVDIAVNCMKDIPQSSERHPNVMIAGVLPREEVVDAVITKGGVALKDLPEGARVGTSSPRRQALVARLYGHLQPVYFRGSSDTRVAKLDAGEVDAVILAVAGLRRIGLAHRISERLDLEVFPPPVGAGIITLDCLATNSLVRELIASISDGDTYLMASAERSFVNTIGGNCETAISGHSRLLDRSTLSMCGYVFSKNGMELLRSQGTAPVSSAEALGIEVARKLLAAGGRSLIEKA